MYPSILSIATLFAIWIAALPAMAAAPPASEPKPGSGSWSVGPVVEPESVEEVNAAMVVTATGFSFAIAREPGGQRVLGILRLPPGDQDMLDETRSVEIQIDDATRFAERGRDAGVEVELEPWEDMIHVFQAFPMLAEAGQAIDRIGSFVRARTKARPAAAAGAGA